LHVLSRKAGAHLAGSFSGILPDGDPEKKGDPVPGEIRGSGIRGSPAESFPGEMEGISHEIVFI